MKLLVSRELLRQVFGLEAPVVRINETEESNVLEFIVGNEEPPHALLRGTASSHNCDGELWHRWEYEVLELAGR